MRKHLVLIFLLLSSPVCRGDILGTVVAVERGDTIEVMDDQFVRYTVGLVGVDAPDLAQSFGPQASAHLTRLLMEKEVRVVLSGSAVDGRLLAKVWVQPRDCSSCGKTLDVNHAQILAGLARWERGHSGDQSAQDRGRYQSAEEEARLRKWGLWGALEEKTMSREPHASTAHL